MTLKLWLIRIFFRLFKYTFFIDQSLTIRALLLFIFFNCWYITSKHQLTGAPFYQAPLACYAMLLAVLFSSFVFFGFIDLFVQTPEFWSNSRHSDEIKTKTSYSSIYLLLLVQNRSFYPIPQLSDERYLPAKTSYISRIKSQFRSNTKLSHTI